MKEIEAIRETLAAVPTPAGALPWTLIQVCTPDAMAAVLAHIEEQAAEIERLNVQIVNDRDVDVERRKFEALCKEQQLEIESLKRGEYICLKCCLRKDAEQPPVDF